MTEYSIPLRDDTVRSLNNASDEDTLELLARDLEASGKLNDIAARYCNDDRGEVTAGSVTIRSDSSVITKHCTGYLRIAFDEYTHYGCADMCTNGEHEHDVEFRIDPTAKEMVLSTPESSLYSYYHGNE